MQSATQIEKVKEGHYRVLRHGFILAAVVYRKFPNGQMGFQYCPSVAGRKFSRVLRSTVRETLLKAGGFKAQDVDAMLNEFAKARRTQTEAA